MKLFLSEESPSLIGLGGQDHLQAKASWPPYTTGAGQDDNLPPGFEESHPANVLHNKLSEISVIQWQCPPKVNFVSNVLSSSLLNCCCDLNLASNCKFCLKLKII